MNDLRWPFLVIATLVSAGILVVEGLLSGPWGFALGWLDSGSGTPGLAITYMALLDASLFFTLLLICASQVWGLRSMPKCRALSL